MTEEQIRLAVLDALFDVIGDAGTRDIGPRTSFKNQMGLDSVDLVALAMSLQRILGIEIPEQDYARLTSLAGCVAYLAPRCRLRQTRH